MTKMRIAALPIYLAALSSLLCPLLPAPAFALRNKPPAETGTLRELAAGLEEGLSPKEALREFRRWIWGTTRVVTVTAQGFPPGLTFATGNEVRVNPTDPEDRRIVEGLLNRLPKNFRVRWEESLPNEEPKLTLVFVSGAEPEKKGALTFSAPEPVPPAEVSDGGVEYLIAGDDPDVPEEPLKNFLHIRWMIRRDMPEVLAIAESIEPPAGWGKANEEDFLRILRQRNAIGMVAEYQDQVVGFVTYELHKARINLVAMMVHPEYRNHGIGRQMVQKVQGKLSLQHRASITLIVPESDLKGQQFLQSQGFIATGIDQRYFVSEDGYPMRYTVPADVESKRGAAGLEEQVARLALVAEEAASGAGLVIVGAGGLEENPALEALVTALSGTELARRTIVWGEKPELDLPTAQDPEGLAAILEDLSQTYPVTGVTFLGGLEEGAVVESVVRSQGLSFVPTQPSLARILAGYGVPADLAASLAAGMEEATAILPQA